MATPEKLYFSTALEIGAGGLLCSTASQKNVSVIIAKQVSHITKGYFKRKQGLKIGLT